MPDERSERSSMPADVACVIAPSGPVPAARLAKGLAVLKSRFPGAVRNAENLAAAEGWLAGADSVRIRATQAALDDPELTAIWAARGGFGATRMLHKLDPRALSQRRCPIIGFSDVTALLCWAWVHAERKGIHGPVVAQLGELPPSDVDRVFELLRGELPSPLQADEGTVLRGGTVEGPLIAGNLEVLRSLIGTSSMPSLRGCILALEEVGERPYRIDRALTHLLASGALRGVHGIAVGQLRSCEEPVEGGSQGPSAVDVVLERLGSLGVPVVTGLPFGHAPDQNLALGFGARHRLLADDATLEQLEPI